MTCIPAAPCWELAAGEPTVPWPCKFCVEVACGGLTIDQRLFLTAGCAIPKMPISALSSTNRVLRTPFCLRLARFAMIKPSVSCNANCSCDREVKQTLSRIRYYRGICHNTLKQNDLQLPGRFRLSLAQCHSLQSTVHFTADLHELQLLSDRPS